MESFFSRYKNPLLLMGVLFIQVIMLASQVKRPDDPRNPGGGGTRLIRIWAVNVVTPVERALIGTGHFFRNTWRNYVDLHDVREQNRKLQAEVDRLRMEQAKLKEDAEQAHRLQQLLAMARYAAGKVPIYASFFFKRQKTWERTDRAPTSPTPVPPSQKKRAA